MTPPVTPPASTARPTRPRSSRTLAAGLATAAAVALVLGGVAGCGSTDSAAGSSPGTAATLRLGYFPNITHATALVGVQNGIYAKDLGSGTTLTTQTFNAGPAEVEALRSGALDAGYLGPNPAINAFSKNKDSLRIVSGAAAGGVQFVVQPGINGPADLRGKHLATPQLGNTQDVALRAWLAKNGLTPSSAATKGDVDVEPTDNGTTLQLFKSKKIDGAWVPEPYASRLVLEDGGKVLLDEKSLWPRGTFVITHLVVRKAFLDKYPNTVKALLQGQVDTTDYILKNPTAARTAANAALKSLSGKPLSDTVLARAWSNIQLTNDPVASSLKRSADDAVAVGLTKPVDLKGIYDLALLRQVLAARNEGAVSDAGLAAGG